MNKYKLYICLKAAVFYFSMQATAQLNIQFNPIPSDYNTTSQDAVYALNINYDTIDMDKQSFHIFLPDTTETYPLVVFIHGGGFIQGSKNIVLTKDFKKNDVKYFLDRGMAYASLDYRLLPTTSIDDTVGVTKCLNDAKRALQYIRYFASDLHINPEKIALKGSSAGAGTCLWLATRSNMANPISSDPVLHLSTRVCVAAISSSQATYDLYKWETKIYNNFDGKGTNYTIDSIANQLGFQRYSNFYGGLDSIYQIVKDPSLIQYRQNVDMLYHMSSDDPALYIANVSKATHPSEDLFHHSFHAREIYNQALSANIFEVKAKIVNLGINTTEGETQNQFIERHLKNCSHISDN